MSDYKKMYFELFVAITDAIELLSNAQRKTEEMYINSCIKEEEEKEQIKKRRKYK